MKKILSLLAFTLISWQVFAQSTLLKGKILDEKTNEPLLGVTIQASNTTYGTVTDFDGSYELSMPYGSYHIVYSYVGYQKVEKDLILNSAEYTQDLILKETVQDLKTVVISASRYQRDSKEETVSMEVIPKTFVTNNNPTSMDQAMQRVPGVTIIDGQANIRAGSGFTYGAGSRVLILTDGLPLLTADAGDAKWNFIPIENLEQVEVIKGAASAVYGSSAMNGIINMRTAYPTSKPETKITSFVNVVGTPSDTTRSWWRHSSVIPSEQGFSFSHKQKFGQFDLVTGANFYNSTSFRYGANETRGRVNVNTRYRFKKVNGLSVGLNSNIQTSKSGTFFIWGDQSKNAFIASAAGGSNVNKGLRWTVDPFVDYFNKRGSKFSLNSRYFYTVNNTDQATQDSKAALYYNEFTYFHPLKSIDMNLVAGVVATFSNVKSDLYKNHKAQNYAGFLQADKKFNAIKLNLTTGFRFEYFKIDTMKGEMRPLFRAGLNKQFGKATFLRASWGQGYRYPSIAELFIKTTAGGLTIVPNPALKPESGWNAEIGLSQGVKIKSLESIVNFALYWQEYKDMMEFEFDASIFGFKSKNVGNTRVAGTELSLLGQFSVGKIKFQYLGGINYALPMRKYNIEGTDTIEMSASTYLNHFVKNIFKTQEEALPEIMYFRNLRTAKADMQATYGKFTIGYGLNYQSLMERINGELLVFVPDITTYMSEHQKGDMYADARLEFQMNENVRFAFLVKNVHNHFYYIRPAYAESPRSFTLSVNYKF